MFIKEMPSQKEIKRYLNYDSDTGLFTWKVRIQKAFKMSGKPAGTRGKKAFHINIFGECFLLHRLAYVYVYGDVLTSEMQVDHKNTNSFDNRIDNLRIATHSQNTMNAKKWKKKDLPKGVSTQTKNANKYRARLQVGKKVVHIGTYNTPEEAHYAYCEAAKKYHGAFTRSA